MKLRIKTRFLVFIALVTLVANIFTGFGTALVQAKTITSGYKIDVIYKDKAAYLNGNSAAVTPGYKLLSLVDESTGQNYDPNSFSMQISKNGTYNFVLNYILDGISSQPQSEKITVVVNQLNVGQARTVRSTESLSVRALQNAQSKEVNEQVPVELYAYENYNSKNVNGSGIKLGNISIPSGEFTSTTDDINQKLIDNKLENRSFGAGTLKRSDGTEVVISGVWNNGGQIYYEPKIDNAAPSKSDEKLPGIAYKAAPGDVIRVYCKIILPKMYALDTTQISNNSKYTDVNIVPTVDKGMIAEGSKVIVTFNWDISIYNVSLKYAYNGQEKDVTLTETYDRDKRVYQGTFTMPAATTVLKVTSVNKANRRWIGLYNSSGNYYQGFEIGGTRLSAITNPFSGGSHNTKAYSQQYRNYGLRTKGSKNGWGIYPIVDNSSQYSDASNYYNATTDLYRNDTNYPLFSDINKNNFLQQSGDTVKGYYDTKGKDAINYPVQDYKAGDKIEIKYEAMRGVAKSYSQKSNWWGPSTKYVYLPASTGNLDVFPNQRNQSTTDDAYAKSFQRYGFRIYQSQTEYNNDPHKEEYDKKYPAKNGLYPVQTILKNGIKITVYPLSYDYNSAFKDSQTVEGFVPNPERSYLDAYADVGAAASKRSDNSLVLPRVTFKIVIENCWDDARVSVGLGTSTIHESQEISGNAGIATLQSRGDTNDNLEYANTNYANGSPTYPFTGRYAPILEGTSQKYHYYKIKPKEGYSIPVPTRVVRKYTADDSAPSVVTIDGSNSSNIVDAANAKNAGDKFIAGRPKGKNSGGSNIAIPAKAFYEDGYYYYSVLVNNKAGSLSQMIFNSSPIKFKAIFKQFKSDNSDYNPYPNGYDVNNQRYFSIPNRLPQGKHNGFFQGWRLTAKIGSKELILTNGSSTNGYYLPGDFVDIVKLNESLKLDKSSIGITEYTLNFEPVYENTSQTSATVTFVKYKQMKLDGSSQEKYVQVNSNNYQVLNNSSFQITGIEDNLSNSGDTYQKNITISSPTFVNGFTGTTKTFNFYYDKEIRVSYSKGINSSGDVPDDSKSYTTVNGNSNVITLKSGSGLSGMNQAKFVGWKIKAGDIEGTKVYNPMVDKTIDLSMLSGETNSSQLRQAIFNAGTVTLEAQYESSLAPITHISGTNGSFGNGFGNVDVTKSDWSYEKTDYTLSATFKWNGDSIPTDAKSKIHYALYKQNPASNGDSLASNPKSGFTLWKSDVNTSNHSSKVSDPVISEINSNDKTFTITFTIKDDNGSIAYKWDNNARYVITAWTTANGAGAFTDSTCPTNFDYTYSKVPYVTQVTKVMKPITTVGATGTSQQLTKSKYIYEGDKYSLQQTFKYDTRLSENELKQNTSIALFKKNPSVTDHRLWYSTDKKFTSDGGSSAGVKFETPVITNVDSKAGTFTVKITNITDSEAVWNSKAEYTLFTWNKSNGNGPITKSSNIYDILQNPDSADTKNIPSLRTTMYVFKDTGSSGGSTNPDTFFTIPKKITLEEKKSAGDKVEISNTSPDLKIGIKGAWLKNDKTQATEDQWLNATDTNVAHDYRYQVSVGSTVGQEPAIQLTQANTSKQITAYYYRYTNSNFEQVTQGNLQLGTIGFASNNDVTSVRFGIKAMEDLSQIKTTDSFSGQAMFNFERIPVSQ